MRAIVAATAFGCAAAESQPQWSVAYKDVDGIPGSPTAGRFIDKFGRERFFHGVNLVYKSAPYFPRTDVEGPLSFTRKDAAFLQKMGLNVVRLGVMWPGVEPREGEYDADYIAQVTEIVHICDQHDISVLFDFHQDGLAEQFCGEGIPWWAADTTSEPDYRKFPGPIAPPFEVKTNPKWNGTSYEGAKIPSLEDCNPLGRDYNSWMASYLSAKNYEDLYMNGRGLRDKFANFWAHLAKSFPSSQFPNIIGFELINEPAAIWPRNYTETEFLQPLYDVLAEAIHAEDPERVLFFNPITWDHGYPPTNAPVDFNGFTHLPGETKERNATSTSVYAYHYYDYDRLYNGQPYFESKLAVADKLKTMGFVTEFELGNVVEHEDDRHFTYSMDIMDNNLQSWMAWTYKGYYPLPYLQEDELPFAATCTGCGSGIYPNLPMSTEVNYKTVRAMARTYAQAVQGKTWHMGFNSTTNMFTLDFQFDSISTKPTVIYVNRDLGDASGALQARYPDGVDVEFLPLRSADREWTDKFCYTIDGSYITVSPKPGIEIPSGTGLQVLIAPGNHVAGGTCGTPAKAADPIIVAHV